MRRVIKSHNNEGLDFSVIVFACKLVSVGEV